MKPTQEEIQARLHYAKQQHSNALMCQMVEVVEMLLEVPPVFAASPLPPAAPAVAATDSEYVKRMEFALAAIRKAAAGGHIFTNRLQFIYERAGVALENEDWSEKWKSDYGYKVRNTALRENEELKERIAELQAGQAAPQATVSSIDILRAAEKAGLLPNSIYMWEEPLRRFTDEILMVATCSIRKAATGEMLTHEAIVQILADNCQCSEKYDNAGYALMYDRHAQDVARAIMALATPPARKATQEIANLTEELDCMNRNYQALLINHRALKSATPSPIKAEPTGEQL
ncbi:MAG: hypothetical protein JWP38_3685 [Herbaspirillum sp.]|nr:hypothetical protein [Herbaspirillum sp.]